MKCLLWFFGILGAAVAALWFSLGYIVAYGVNTVAPDVVGVPVHVGAVSVSPLSGAVEINDFVVGNPEGYEADYAVKLDKLSVKVQPLSFLTDKMVVDSIVLEGPSVWVEGSLAGENNLKAIQQGMMPDMVNEMPAQEPVSGVAEEEPVMQESAAGQQKMLLKEFVLKDTNLKLSLNQPVRLDAVDLVIPEIRMMDVGGENGTTPDQVAAQVVGGVMDSIQNAGAQAVQATLAAMKDVSKEAEDLGTSIKDKVKSFLNF